MIQGEDIICLASANFDAPAWVNVQHLMWRLARAGNRVLYIESPGLRAPHLLHPADLRKAAHRISRLFQGVRRPHPNLTVVAPHVLPGHHRPLWGALNQKLLLRQIRSWAERLGMHAPLLWIYLPTGSSLAGHLNERLLIYHCVDDYLANPGVPVEALRKMEDHLVARADAVLVTAPRLLDKFCGRAKRLLLVPSGVDTEPFFSSQTMAEPADLKSIPHPRIGFVGNLTGYKVDFTLLEMLAQAHSEWHLVLIGSIGIGDPSTRIGRLKDYRNVHWLGEKHHREVPPYLMGLDVGLIPYHQNSSTEHVFPVKLLEYFAAGLPVVATPLPSLESFQEHCVLAAHPTDFVKALERTLQNPLHEADQRRAIAARNSWEARLEEISRFLEPMLARDTPHLTPLPQGGEEGKGGFLSPPWEREG